ncbi:MAG: flagellar hook-associated protein FlgL [Oceanicoccus sp.]
MAIRFSFLQGFNTSVQDMQRIQQQAFETQEQIASGRRILTPADDPVASARIIQVNQELSQLDQYLDNADSVESRLTLAEIQVEQVTTLLIRVRELTIQSDALSMTKANRQAIATELDTRLDELLDIANTRDVNGEYIFAGYQGSEKPFEQTAAGEFVYRGDDGQRLVQVASSTQIPISDSGKRIFMDIDSVQTRVEATAEAGNSGAAVVVASRVTDQVNYDDNSYPEDYVIQFNGIGNQYDVYARPDILDGGVNTPLFSVANSGSPITIDANATPLAAPTNLGWEITVAGTPADGDLFYANSTQKQDVLTTIAKLSEGMKTLGDSPAHEILFDQLVAETLNNLDAAELNMSEIKSEIGARQNTVDSVRTLHQQVELINNEVLSDIRDLDYAEALSRLSIETFTLEASQQSFVRISSLSLFNFLR